MFMMFNACVEYLSIATKEKEKASRTMRGKERREEHSLIKPPEK